MNINEDNKRLYELAFIENGEYGYNGQKWNPSIDERDIDTMCEDEDGNYKPATPLGYREYTKSRLQGLKNIFDQYPSVDLTNDKLHNLKREDNEIRQYDKIKTDKGEFIVVGDDEEKFFIVNNENKQYYVDYKNE